MFIKNKNLPKDTFRETVSAGIHLNIYTGIQKTLCTQKTSFVFPYNIKTPIFL